MKSLFIIGILVLVGCASYSSIDSKKWVEFEGSYKDSSIRYSLPGGYFSDEPHSNNDYKGLAKYHYDILSGTGIYGQPWGETTVAIIVSYSKSKTLPDYVNSRLASDLSHCKSSILEPWNEMVCDVPSEGYLTQFNIMAIGEGEYLTVIFRIRDKAYQRTKIKNQRIRMFKDILNTFRVKNA